MADWVPNLTGFGLDLRAPQPDGILAVERDAPLVPGWGEHTPIGNPYHRVKKKAAAP